VTRRFGPTIALSEVSWAPQPGQVTALVEAPALFTGLSVRRNLRIHSVLTGAGQGEIGQVAELTRTEQVLDRRVGTLSQGYRQRVAIAIALLGSPGTILLDEPTNALDPEATAHLRGLLKLLAGRGAAVIVSTHMLRELEGVADALTILHEGRILYDGPFASFVGPTSLRIRTPDAGSSAALVRALQTRGVDVEGGESGVRAMSDSRLPADRLARLVFSAAAEAGVELVELGHITPTLEEAFHHAISGARP
jgi:ABC-2 type transport system ATP-binding protein